LDTSLDLALEPLSPISSMGDLGTPTARDDEEPPNLFTVRAMDVARVRTRAPPWRFSHRHKGSDGGACQGAGLTHSCRLLLCDQSGSLSAMTDDLSVTGMSDERVKIHSKRLKPRKAILYIADGSVNNMDLRVLLTWNSVCYLSGSLLAVRCSKEGCPLNHVSTLCRGGCSALCWNFDNKFHSLKGVRSVKLAEIQTISLGKKTDAFGKKTVGSPHHRHCGPCITTCAIRGIGPMHSAIRHLHVDE
jgi:hypothetical protein